MNFVCKDCGFECETKHIMYEHQHVVHKLQMKSHNFSKCCKYCHQTYDGRIRDHLKVCANRRRRDNFKWTEEEKKNLSIKRKQYLKEHPDAHPWKRREKFVSKPCEHLKQVLKSRRLCF